MDKNVFFAVLLAMSMLAPGCASNLPDVKSVAEMPAAGPPEIRTADGVLPPSKSRAAISNIEKEAGAREILERQVKLTEEISGRPLFAGNKATLLASGAKADAAMEKAIRRARHSINLETFIFSDDETGLKFADLLLKKRAEGVQVNVIYDSAGSMHTSSGFFQRMRGGGIRVLEYNPINPFKARRKWLINRRDHRKILVVDGKTAFTGGVNISGVYSSGASHVEGREGGKAEMPWRDTNVMIEGPAVAEFQRLFLGTWKWQNGPKLSEREYFPPLRKEGDDYVMVVGSRPGEMNRLTYIMYYTAFKNAENFIHLTSAYFVPDEETMDALTAAARRGVEVKLVLPSRSDIPVALYAGRSYYTRLLESGVRVYERKGGVLHAKTAVVDGAWSTVGSTNMDMWSFSNNNEVNAVILGKDFADEMEAMFGNDLKESKEVTLEQWEERPLFKRLRDSFARLFMRWL